MSMGDGGLTGGGHISRQGGGADQGGASIHAAISAMRTVAGVIGVACALILPASAAASNLFSLDANAVTGGPVVTDPAGNAYIAWERKATGGSEASATVFCKVSPGGSCTSPIVLPLPGATGSGEEPVEPYPVLGSQANIVYVVGPRYTPDDTLIWTSEDGGAHFSAAKEIKSYAGRTGVDDVLLNPLHLATKAKPTSDRFDVASNNPGIGFSEAANEGTTNLELNFASPGGFASSSSLAFTATGLPIEAYWIDEDPVQVRFYVNKGGSTEEEKNWKGPETVADGYLPRLAGGPDGVFMLSEDYLPGESTENSPEVLELRKFNETSDQFEAPVQIARSNAGLFEPGDIFQNPTTGTLYIVWPETSGGLYVMKLWESTDGGHTFHGERNVAVIGYSYEGPPRLAVAADGQGWLTFKDEGGLEVANLNSLVSASPEPISAPSKTTTPTPTAPPPSATSVATVQAGGGISGAALTVPQGTAVTDQAIISGAAAANAGGTVTYNLYKDSKCTVAAAAGSVTGVVKGVGAPSAPIRLKAGTYYWRVTYSGDGANAASASTCGGEVLVVALSASHLGLPSSKLCLSKRAFLVHPRAPKGVKLVSVEVQINGRTVKKGKLSNHATTVSLVGLPKGTFRVGLITRSSRGKVYEEVRTFHTCVPKKHGKK
jgi:hypothetical protein